MILRSDNQINVCKKKSVFYFMLLDSLLIVVDVFCRRLNLDLSDAVFCASQPIRKLLQLLLLELHQDFVEPKSNFFFFKKARKR